MSWKTENHDGDVVRLWRTSIVKKADVLDGENDKGGHDWHSLWTGFVIALGRPDLSGYAAYARLGLPEE